MILFFKYLYNIVDPLCWPKSLFRFFCNILWKNSNEYFGQPHYNNPAIKKPSLPDFAYRLVFSSLPEREFIELSIFKFQIQIV